jgi:DNA primase
MTELAQVLEHYGLLKDEASYKIVCPFHNDVNASLLLNIVNNSFYCFGCGARGDALAFVKKMNEKKTELEQQIIFQKIINNSSLDIAPDYEIKKIQKENVDYRQRLVEAINYYKNLPKVDWRKIETEEKQYLLKRGYKEETLNKFNFKINYNTNYPIIIPIYDNNIFKGWIARTIDKEVEKKRKYLYNKGYRRSKVLAGDCSRTIFITEGYLDKIKLNEFGIKNAVALMGWKATESQIKKLKAYGVKRIVSCLDNDKYGKEGTEYLKNFFTVLDFEYPSWAKDPGDLDRNTFYKNLKKILRGEYV